MSANAGKDVEKFLTYDPGPVEKRYDQLKMRDRNELDLNPDSNVDVQTVKLLVAHDYMLKRRKEQVEQLEELKSWVTP